MVVDIVVDFVVVVVDVAVVVVIGKVVEVVDGNLVNDVVDSFVVEVFKGFVVVVEVVEYGFNEFNKSMNFELRKNGQNDSLIFLAFVVDDGKLGVEVVEIITVDCIHGGVVE